MNVKFKAQTADPIHLQIERHLQRQILTGALRPAQRLPTTQELAAEWNVSGKTVQLAMQRLNAAGLIERKPMRGTFVRARTEKALIGIIIGADLLHADTYFDRALVKAIQTELQQYRWDYRVYDLGGRQDKEKAEICRHLLWDIRNHTFKGLVCYPSAGRFRDEVFSTDLPKVFLGAEVIENKAAFARSAVDELARRGRKRLFYLRTGSLERGHTDDIDGFWESCAAHGLKASRGSICQARPFPEGARYGSAEWAGYDQMRDLIDAWEKRGSHPDGLIVKDDVMMRGVAVALREQGVRVPEDLEVVCATSEEIHHLYAVPVIRYEYPITEVARQLVSRLWKMIAGETVDPQPAVIQGRFADDTGPAAAGRGWPTANGRTS